MVAVAVQTHAQTLPLQQHKQQVNYNHVDRAGWIRQSSKLASSPCRSDSLLHRRSRLQPSCPTRSPCPASIISLCEQGKLSAALDVLPLSLKAPSHDVYLAILKKCNKVRDGDLVKRLHRYLLQHHVDLTGALGIVVVETLAQCGCIEEALQIFHRLHHRPISLWTVLMAACNQHKQSEKTLELYSVMLEDGVEPGNHVLASVFKACSNLHDLQEGKKVHADSRARGLTLDTYVNNSLVSMYGKCGDIFEAESVFVAMPERMVASWTSMMSAYVDVGQGEKALQLYRLMLSMDISPNQHTFAVAIQACCVLFDKSRVNDTLKKLLCLEIGQSLHADANRNGYGTNTFVSTTLVHMYGELGTIQEAENVFFLVSQPDSVLCNAMMCAYIEQGQAELALQLYRHMLWQGVLPDQKTFVLAVQACGFLAENEEPIVVDGHALKPICVDFCRALHYDAQNRGFGSNIFLRTTFIGVYAKCGMIDEAEKVFREFDDPPQVVSWTAMISAYVEQGKEEFALQLFRQMQEGGILPNTQTYVVVIQACTSLGERAEDASGWTLPLEIGMALHADARKRGLDSNIFLNTALLGMYGMCGKPTNAEIVFSRMQHRDLVAWNAMLNVYVEHDEKNAIQVYRRLLQEGMVPNEKTFVSVFQACGNLVEKENADYMPELVSALHDDVQKCGFSCDIFIGNSLVTVYGIMGYLEKAEAVFNALLPYKIVSWNAMLSIYVQHGQGEKALRLYRSMQNIKGINVNDVTLVCILQACEQTGKSELSKQVHFALVASGNELSSSLASALIGAYGNCGSMEDALAIFDSMPLPDVISWNACLAACAGQGSYKSSIQMLTGMQVAGCKPDAVTLTSVLSACSHSGFLMQGLWYFEVLCRSFDILPGPRHFSSVVDLIGRTGDICCLELVLERLVLHPDLNFWQPLLGACCLPGNLCLAKQAFTNALSLSFEDASAFIIVSNMYADSALHNFMVPEDDVLGWNACMT